jgi:hypothetical protein
MATWRQMDKLETQAALASSAMAEFMATLLDVAPELEPQRWAVMEAARVAVDQMRIARRSAEEVVLAERGWRK